MCLQISFIWMFKVHLRSGIERLPNDNEQTLHDYYLTSEFSSCGLVPIECVRVATCAPQQVRRGEETKRDNFVVGSMSHHSLRTLLAAGYTMI